MDGRIRLDIGAGHFRQKGWLAVDHVGGYSKKLKQAVDPDIESDIRKLPLPDDYADEARAIHVIEHLQPWEALATVTEWVRVLKPGAELAIECPCLEKVIKLFDVPQIDPRYTYWAFWGDPRHGREDMMHKWGYTHFTLMNLMAQAGLTELRKEVPQFHFPIRDMRVVGVKPKSNLIVQP